MNSNLQWVMIVLTVALYGCRSSTPPSAPAGQRSQTAATSSAAAPARPGAFSRAQLIEDARQLAAILESARPDPCLNRGGRIAFHRRLHRVLNAIPDEGMTKDEFFRLIRPFIAGIGDAHTNFLGGYDLDRRRPGGVPLRLAVVESMLYVAGVTRTAQRDLLGARLASVEGVPLAELLERQMQLRGIDNQYHALQTLAEQSLRYRQYMQDLIPEWKDLRRVRVQLIRADGIPATADLAQAEGPLSWITPESRVALPVPGSSGFLYSFLKAPPSQREIAYVRFTHMVGYREAREARETLLTRLKRPPSATDTFRSMAIELKKRDAETLVVYVRGNGGGNSLIVDILVYFLYGKEMLAKLHGFGTGETGVFRHSSLFFADRPGQSLEAINADRFVPLVEGDYDFSWSYVDGKPIARRSRPPEEPAAFQYLRASATFRPEFEAGT